MTHTNATLTPELVRDLARCAGLDLPVERAADLIPLLEPLLLGDARVAALNLNGISPIGALWPEARHA